MGGTTGRSVSGMPGLDAAEQRAWEHFLEAALRMYGVLNRTLSAEHQLSLLDFRLLEILRNSETGAARMGDLAERLLSQPSRVTRQIRRLEAAGLVLREASPEDGRGVLAGITEQGRRAVAAAIVTYSDGVRRQFVKPLTRPQMSAMGENCRRITTELVANGSTARSARSRPLR